MFAPITVFSALIGGAWLAVCSVCDWRKREVPLLLTYIPFAIAILWSAIYGNAPASLLSVLLLFIVSLERCPVTALSILSLAFAIILGLFILDPIVENFIPLFIIFGVYLLWYFDGTGGSDARILVTITLAFGAPVFVYSVLAGGVVGLIALARKKKTIPYVIPITLGTVAYFMVNLIR